MKDADGSGAIKLIAAAVRANHPIPLQQAKFYFEVTILDGGKDEYA